MENLKEFKELIERYASITLEDIKNTPTSSIGVIHRLGRVKANLLTGFGSTRDCTLCRSCYLTCSICAWNVLSNTNEVYCCQKNYNEQTYSDIRLAETDAELLKAFQARAKYMREVLERWEKKAYHGEL